MDELVIVLVQAKAPPELDELLELEPLELDELLLELDEELLQLDDELLEDELLLELEELELLELGELVEPLSLPPPPQAARAIKVDRARMP